MAGPHLWTPGNMASVNRCLGVLLGLLTLHTALGSNFRHVGCYRVPAASSGARYNYGTLRLEQCATGCNSDGYPFFTLRQGRDCVCVGAYGQEGAAPYSSMCDQTCTSDGVTFLCGGSEYEDVYYAVDTDSRTILPLRHNVLHPESQPFDEARAVCVRENGDLPIMVNEAHLDSLWELVKDVNSTGVWVGLYRNTWGDGAFSWAGLNLRDPSVLLNVTADSSVWSRSNSFSGDCAILMRTEKKLKAVDCTETYPYLCHQIPTVSTTPAPTTPEPTTPEPTPSAGPVLWSSETTRLAFTIVIVLFFFLFGGSCLLYACHHCCRHFRRRQRRRQRADALRRSMADFEPDTAPLAEEDPPLYSSRPVTARDVMVNNRKSSSAASDAPYCKTPIQEVHMEDEAPPLPVKTAAVSRVGSSAVSGLDSRMSTALPGDWPEPDVDDDDDANLDFTQLSIQDIMYVKMILGDNDIDTRRKRKKKKILVA